MESYQNALSRAATSCVTLERRVLDRPLAAVRVVDMREEYAAEGPDVDPQPRAARGASTRASTRREQALVLLNRRGFATAVFCRQCGDTLECPNCSVSLTVHKRAGRRARCHYCNYSMPRAEGLPRSAPARISSSVGFGTERVEAELARRFPGARVGARRSRHHPPPGRASRRCSRGFAAGELDVLVGTQMIAKGHDFPRVTLVGVISAPTSGSASPTSAPPSGRSSC